MVVVVVGEKWRPRNVLRGVRPERELSLTLSPVEAAHTLQIGQLSTIEPKTKYSVQTISTKEYHFDISNIIKHLTTGRTLTNIALLPNKQTKTFRPNISPTKELRYKSSTLKLYKELSSSFFQSL